MATNSKNNVISLLLIVFVLVPLLSQSVYAQEYNRIVRLKGYWKFSIGDKKEWKEASYDDSKWDKIYVPSPWEDEGFHGYDGYAWYRTDFEISSKYKNKMLMLKLGKIDDVDEVYLNGKLVGKSGEFPPHYRTAWDLEREYEIPNNLLNYNGKNIIAVRVYDEEIQGGIYWGSIGIYEKSYGMTIDKNLEGDWKFTRGDNWKWKDPQFDDSRWETLRVPGRWDSQGYSDYDGFGWYRKDFTWNNEVNDDEVVLVLGKIDDMDQVYLNGEFVGSTGDMIAEARKNLAIVYYKQLRGYRIESSKLKKGRNVIAVRIFDNQEEGGIYEGPIGITSMKEYLHYLSSKDKRKSFFDF